MSIAKIKVQAKTSDRFNAELFDENGNTVHEEHGYVPQWMPGCYYGDGLVLEIDNKTGQILNWKEITKEMVKAEDDEDDEVDDDEDRCNIYGG